MRHENFKGLQVRSLLESDMLDLIAEVSSLKIRLATAENERRKLEDRLKGLQVRLLLGSDKLDLMTEVSSLKIRQATAYGRK